MYPELITTGMQFETIGHSNIRSGKPDPNGEFQSIIDVIRQGTIVTIQKVDKWEQTGFIWAEITY